MSKSDGIADCHWRACETCKHGEEGGCEIQDEIYYKLDPYSDTIICELWVKGV